MNEPYPAPPNHQWNYFAEPLPTWQLTGPSGVVGLVQRPMANWVASVGDSILDDTEDACSGELERAAKALVERVTGDE